MTIPTHQMIGKIPPQAIDLEKAILGSFMLEKDRGVSIPECHGEMFYSTGHQLIFDAIYEIYNNREPIDLLTVTSQLRKDKNLDTVGGAYYLSQLTSSIATTANLDYYIKIVKEKYILRKMISISDEVKGKSFDDDADALKILGDSMNELLLMQGGISTSRTTKIDKALDDLMDFIESPQTELGIPSLFPEINGCLNDFQQSKLYILGARPGMGKTAYVLQEANNMARKGKSVGFISLEMSTEELAIRLSAVNTGIDSNKISRRELSEEEILRLQKQDVYDKNLLIDDSGNMTLADIGAFCHKMKQDMGLDMLIVDFLQLVGTGKKQSTYDKISEVARGLKQLAKQFKIPVIALSQLNREVEKRPDKFPQLSDLKESGAIEEMADAVIFMWRPAYYKIDSDSHGERYPQGHTVFSIPKHRGGNIGDVCLTFHPSTVSFGVNIEYEFGQF